MGTPSTRPAAVRIAEFPIPGVRPPRWGRLRATGIAAAVLVLVVVAAVLGPLLSPWSATAVDLDAVRAGPSTAHWLGTDHLGRDELTRLLLAARTSLATVAAVFLLAVPFGVAVGLAAGWRGGLLDVAVLRITDVAMALPALLVGLVLASVWGAGLLNLSVALAAASWAPYARLVRTEVKLLRDLPFTQALVLLGARPRRVLLRHLLPAVLGSVVVLVSTDVAATVLAVSTMTFLGLGVRPPVPEWGSMIIEARPYLADDPRLFLLPMIGIGAVVLAANVLAEGAGRWVSHGASVQPSAQAPRSLPASTVGSASNRSALLEVRDLTVELTGPIGRRRVVDGVDLTVGRGEVLALIGASGSGKSVTAAALLGVLPDGAAARVTGSIRFAGEELCGRPEREWRRHRGARIALVPQDLAAALNPLRRVGAQVAQAARLHRGLSRTQAETRARELLEWVGIEDAEQVARLRPAELSGGMRQRVLIAAALAGGPDLLVADEPTSALDSTVARQVLDVLAQARAEFGTAVVVITHDLAVVADWADHLVVLDGGRVVESGPCERLLRDPRHEVTRGLRDAAAPRTPVAAARVPGGQAVLQARGVGVLHRGRGLRRGSRAALTEVSVDLAAGGGLGVIGESGSGKSTLTRVLVGLQGPTTGVVRLAGAAPRPGDGRAQLVFQDPTAALDRRQTVAAALTEALILAHRRGDADPAGRDDVADLLRRVGLDPDLRERRPWQLSGGQRQRVVIARALAARPTLLVLDEPVSSLDAVVRTGVLDVLRGLRANGMAMVVVSHDLTAIEALVEDVVVLHRGRVVEQGPTARVLARPRHPVTESLVRARAITIPIPQPPHPASKETTP